MNRCGAVVLVLLLGACGRSPLGLAAAGGGGGASGATSGTNGGSGGSGGGTGGGLPIARTGDDGICGPTFCPSGQQCCLSSGKCVNPSDTNACPLPTPPPAVCGGVTCAVNQICCLLNGKCVDPTTVSSTCTKPSVPTPDASSTGAAAVCASNADCAATQFCAPTSAILCQGPGTCRSRSNCGSSSGAQFCGCDGVTYPDLQTACRAGIPIIASNACGTSVDQEPPGALGPRDPVTYCATSGQCPQGQQCCSITGRCYDASVPYLCTFPPPGSSLSCLEDKQCGPFQFCSGPGCSGPGGCVSPGSCGGELKAVCGCDGKSYTNAGCALAVAVRVAGAGVCSDIDAGAGP